MLCGSVRCLTMAAWSTRPLRLAVLGSLSLTMTLMRKSGKGYHSDATFIMVLPWMRLRSTV
jgi:hypothetical protein